MKLPTADEGVGVNVGYEYRKERVRYTAGRGLSKAG